MKSRHIASAMVSLLLHWCVALLPFSNPLLWPHGMVKCLSDAHFRNSVEVVRHLVSFLLNTVNSVTYFIVGKYI